MAFVLTAAVVRSQSLAGPSAGAATCGLAPAQPTSAACAAGRQRKQFEGRRVCHGFVAAPSFHAAAAAPRHAHVPAPAASASTPAAAPIISFVGSSPRKALEGVLVYNSEKQPYEVAKLWGDREVVVLALMRHLGCPWCWELASALDKIRPELEAAGVKVALVSVGLPEKAAEFSSNHGFPLDRLYMSPDRAIYDALGLHNGLGRTFFNPSTGRAIQSRGFESLKEATKNYKMIMPPSSADAFQQGGVFVLAGDSVSFEHRDEGTGDHPDFARVSDAALAAAAAL